MRSASRTHDQAKALRRALTPPELALWTRLRVRGPGQPAFRRQHPFGPYILDFFCAKALLAIKVDGQSHGHGDRPVRDTRRDAYLAREGLQAAHYRAAEIMRDPDGVAQAIFETAAALISKRA